MKTAVAWLAALVVTLAAYGYQPSCTSGTPTTRPAPSVAGIGTSGFQDLMHLVTTTPRLLGAVEADADRLLRHPRLLWWTLESSADEARSSARVPHE